MIHGRRCIHHVVHGWMRTQCHSRSTKPRAHSSKPGPSSRASKPHLHACDLARVRLLTHCIHALGRKQLCIRSLALSRGGALGLSRARLLRLHVRKLDLHLGSPARDQAGLLTGLVRHSAQLTPSEAGPSQEGGASGVRSG
jgi:hypothetical protein